MKKKSNANPFSKNKGFKIFGIGKQEAIKYFFGGNAFISIIVLILITIFLAKEAFLFFPQYQTNLNIYRKSGKEYADFAYDQQTYQQEIKSLVTQVKQYELFHRAGIDAYIPPLYSAMKNVAVEKMKAELLSLKISKERISSKEMIWEFWAEDEDPQKQQLAKRQKAEFEAKLASAQQTLSAKIKDIAPNIKISDLSVEFQKKAYNVNKIDPSIHSKIQDALITYYEGYSTKPTEPKLITDSQQLSEQKRAKLLEDPFFESLSAIETPLVESIKQMDTFNKQLRDNTLLVSVRSYTYLTAPERAKAIEEGIPEATPEERKKLKIRLERLVTNAQDYDSLAEQNIYSTLAPHKELMSVIVPQTKAHLSKLPATSEFTNKEAKAIRAKLAKAVDEYEDFMANQRENMENYRHDKEIGMLRTVSGFFFGEKWVANSSWNNFFGLKPLFAGSFFITIIAITLATPFAIGSAIYVNRIASPLEQTIVKPIIEFIQAIPSVVLAFLGVVVVGQGILKLSYVSWLDWLPGFPAEGEQNMLTAGVLLAFMAIPTMFTLAEDAINNVPKSYNEASLALGATRLQTVFRVIVPCALSGVVAAVLLGFGRIIGETMVVLLVAGGTIDWPETWTSPVHTMTGIIAQSTGEAAPGSIQYRALFLIGLVLFLISLSLNSLAQRVIKKYGNKG